MNPYRFVKPFHTIANQYLALSAKRTGANKDKSTYHQDACYVVAGVGKKACLGTKRCCAVKKSSLAEGFS